MSRIIKRAQILGNNQALLRLISCFLINFIDHDTIIIIIIINVQYRFSIMPLF